MFKGFTNIITIVKLYYVILLTNVILVCRQGIQKVAKMLQDRERTRFVVICIAEYLSICETRRLLQELRKVKL